MPDVRTPLVTKSHVAQGDGYAQLSLVYVLLASAFLLLTTAIALASEAHLPHAIQSAVSYLSNSASARFGLHVGHTAALELLVGTSGFVASAAVGLGVQKLYSRHDVRSVDKHKTTARAQTRHSVSSRVGGLMKALGSAEERQRLQALEQDAGVIATVAEEGRAPIIPPVEEVGANSWRVHGMYEHQLLKAGLQHLDAAWPSAQPLELASGSKTCAILRKKLFTDLLRGEVHLRSVPACDLAAAQGDMRHLSLAQLLRLRVLHIDFVPSGTGADTVSNIGSAHQTFISLLDRLLFEQLGRKAAAGASNKSMEAAEAHRFGREGVLIVAAASSLPSFRWWSWWITDECRVFFDVKRFISIKEFPKDGDVGVLDVKVDRSRSDPNEPTGRLRWFDWSIELAASEDALAQAPPSLSKPGSGKGASKNGVICNSAAAISVETLSNARRGLRQTRIPEDSAAA